MSAAYPPTVDIQISRGHIQGNEGMGYYVQVRSLGPVGERKVILVCRAGNLSFQHSMTPTEARELVGYLQAEANYCEQFGKEVAA